MMLRIITVLVLAVAPMAHSQEGAGSSCQSLGDRLFTGNCKSFVNYFKDKADYAITQSDSAFKGTVGGAPYPSDACCYDARDFTTSGCSCDATVIEGGKRNGLKENAIRIIARATMFSRCTGSQFGGDISNGGC
ncbi:hypothetical protein CVIRNUC_006661 [Coccomyxa viridis]|uniref:Extracellular protein n=1 Tax=Coccomyxa viridis TaxID=1274662 RepID=A0AAV1IB61_9CHLO|nr:hypothetical protein CVIRNUC_006661 [Coccomyxa viridis]